MRENVRGPGGSASSGLDLFERDHDGIRILGVSGDLDLGTAGTFCARVDAARAAGSRRLLLDFSQLRFCDSSGLRALIGAADEVVASAGRVVVVPPVEGPAARLFAVTGTEELLPLYPSVAEALTVLRTNC